MNTAALSTLPLAQLKKVSGGIGLGFGTNGVGLTGSGPITSKLVWTSDGVGLRLF